jgi:iron(III) transport system substrate-binding protein
MRYPVTPFLLGVLLLVLALVVACSPPAAPAPAPTPEPAVEEDVEEAAEPVAEPPAVVGTELNLLCTPQVEWCEGMKENFERLYPDITVNFVRMSSGEALARLRAEQDDPQFDIWWGGPIDSFIAAKADGLLEPYASPNLANLTNAELFRDQADPPEWAGVYVGSLGFATNLNKAEELGIDPPTSFEDLLDPRLNDQIMIAHPSTSGTSYTFVCTVLQVMGEDEGWDYLRQFNNNVFQYTRSGAAPGRFVGAGEATVAIVFSHDIVTFIEEGFPLDLSFIESGTGYEVGGMALIKGAKNPDTARLWYDWALTSEAQSLGPEYRAYQGATVGGVTHPRPELLEVPLINYDFEWCGENKSALVDRYVTELASDAEVRE